jgi:hypothetical protein
LVVPIDEGSDIALGFAPEQDATLPPEIALAFLPPPKRRSEGIAALAMLSLLLARFVRYCSASECRRSG